MPKVCEIGETVADELGRLIDYDGCRVYVVEGNEARPVACRGEAEAVPSVRAGEGIVGRVAASGEPLMVPNVAESEFAQAGGRDESVLAVPLRFEERVVGVIFVSKLGAGCFDEGQLRLVEVLAGHTAVGLENARLYAELQDEIEHARVWLEFADALATEPTIEAICAETPKRVAGLLGVQQCSLWLQDRQRGDYTCAGSYGYLDDPLAAQIAAMRFPPEMPDGFFAGRSLPFVVEQDELKAEFFPDAPELIPPAIAYALLPTGYGLHGWIAVRLPQGASAEFTESRLRLLDGIAYRASMALQRALLYRDQQESNEVANALLECARELVSKDSLEDKLRRIVELAAQTLGSPTASLWFENETGNVGLTASYGHEPATIEKLVAAPYPGHVASQFLQTSDAYVITPEVFDAHGMESPWPGRRYAIAPLPASPDDPMGCIMAPAPEPGDYEFSPAKLRLLMGLAEQARIVLAVPS